MTNLDGGWFGATVGSTRSTGSAPASDWAEWERAGRAQPSAIGQSAVEAAIEDVEAMAAVGLTHLLFTVEWALIEPENGLVDIAALERYATVLSRAQELGLSTVLTLHERSLPGWFAIDERGFRDQRSLHHLWPRHVDRCGEAFADLVTGWVPTLDPLDWAAAGQLTGWAPPGVQSLERFRETLVGAHQAQLEAAKALRGAGNVFAMYDVFDVNIDQQDPEAAAAGKRVDQLSWCAINGWRENEFHLPELGAIEMAGYRDAFDGCAIRFSGSVGVDANGLVHPHPSDEGLARTIDRVSADGPDKPTILIGGRRGLETDRGATFDALATELAIVRDAQRSGLPVAGYLHDRAVDGYEWTTGFDLGTGLFTRDRAPKPALELFGLDSL